MNFELLNDAALLSSAAYEDRSLAKHTAEKLGWHLQHFHIDPISSVQYLLLENNIEQILVVRGTANIDNVRVDLDVEFKHDPIAQVQIHKGFSLAANALWQDVKSRLKVDRPIRATGHSLGGAVAVVLAMYIERSGYVLKDVVTFGQPKVTNVKGAKVYQNMPLTRVVTPLDIVPIVPPLSPLEIKRLDIYWHNGNEVILMGKRRYSQVSGVKSMLRAANFLDKVPDEENLIAHEMKTYIDRIEFLKNDSKEVPYNMDLKLFGFSLN